MLNGAYDVYPFARRSGGGSALTPGVTRVPHYTLHMGAHRVRVLDFIPQLYFHLILNVKNKIC